MPEIVLFPATIVLFVKVCEAVSNAIALVLDKSVEAIVIFALPSNDCPAIVLAFARAVAVEAFPVTAPSTFATKVPVAIVKLPVASFVAVVVPTTNLSALSSQAIIALSPVLPLSIRIPESFAFEPAPEFNSNRLSEMVVFVVATVVVVPLTVKLPLNVKLANCTLEA